MPRYELRDELGRGGMGIVYRAFHPALQREVAIKVIVPGAGLGDGNGARRFERETRALIALSHPNIVRILDAGEQDGQLFYAMELVEGRDLKTILSSDGPLPVETALSILDQLLDALDYVHGLGMIHRDIKTSNVMIHEATGRAVLMDFGLVKIMEATTLTVSGGQLGTPLYLAPEIVDSQPATVATDLWAIGVVAHEMLAGRHPFGHGRVMELAMRILNAPATPLREIRPEVPAALEAFVLRFLEKEPERRWRGAAAAREELVSIRLGRGPAAGRASGGADPAADAVAAAQPRRRTTQRRVSSVAPPSVWQRAGALGLALLAVVLVVGLGRLAFRSRAPEPSPAASPRKPPARSESAPVENGEQELMEVSRLRDETEQRSVSLYPWTSSTTPVEADCPLVIACKDHLNSFVITGHGACTVTAFDGVKLQPGRSLAFDPGSRFVEEGLAWVRVSGCTAGKACATVTFDRAPCRLPPPSIGRPPVDFEVFVRVESLLTPGVLTSECRESARRRLDELVPVRGGALRTMIESWLRFRNDRAMNEVVDAAERGNISSDWCAMLRPEDLAGARAYLDGARTALRENTATWTAWHLLGTLLGATPNLDQARLALARCLVAWPHDFLTWAELSRVERIALTRLVAEGRGSSREAVRHRARALDELAIALRLLERYPDSYGPNFKLMQSKLRRTREELGGK